MTALSGKGADELLDQAGRLRGPWRRMLGTLLGMGTAALRDRSAELDRACAEEGAAALPARPGAGAWRCDAIPFLLTEAEFSTLAEGLAQRATVLEAVLADLYGPRRLLDEGLLPPALVYASQAYIRACRTVLPDAPAPGRQIQIYAADLVRGPDGRWCVLADRTGEPAGLAYALENRRLLARVLPELFRSLDVGQLRPFLDSWQDTLQRLAPHAAGNPGLALLTPGHADPRWFEHVVLARALGCALVEDDDLTVRQGALWVKTLRGLQPVHVLLRRQRGGAIDQLELQGDTHRGTPGLMTAWRQGTVQVLNGPGAGYGEAPGLGAFLPAIARALTGRDLALAGVETVWLGDAEGLARVRAHLAADPASWHIVSATDGAQPAASPATMGEAALAALHAGIAARPWAYAATAPPPPSFTPCVGAGETLEPRPVSLRLFLLWDGAAWRPLQGGLARVLEADDAMARAPPHTALCKDVWVLQEEGLDIYGPGNLAVPRLAPRRMAGDIPSRVADNFYWLGRYLERLENAARLIRTVLSRLARDTLLPRDVPDLAALIACLIDAGIVAEELAAGASTVQLADLLVRALGGDAGTIARLTGRVRDLADLLRDRLSGEMHDAIAHDLRRLKGERLLLRPGQRAVGIGLMQDFAGEVLKFCATVAGYAAENMVRGGGRLFLDLGRRIERAQAVAGQLAHALGHRPERMESGLMLALEVCDSALTYRSRYLTAVQAATVIDLVVADEGNPRGLAFQLASARQTLVVLAGGEEGGLAAALDGALAETRLIVADLLDADDQAVLAAGLAPRLRVIGAQVAALSDSVMRRYFALLPVTFTDGMPTGQAEAGEVSPP
jgi:uncharacterized circularly permuted ATP-grasp superfamily protein/uncharacterized alpha-E superfamily protein